MKQRYASREVLNGSKARVKASGYDGEVTRNPDGSFTGKVWDRRGRYQVVCNDAPTARHAWLSIADIYCGALDDEGLADN